MVVADIHGNLEDYNRIIQTYQKKKKSGEVDGLIFAGDTIHARSEKDESKEIIDDLIKLTSEDKNIHVILGNHELPHIYNFTLAFRKSDADVVDFTKDFELKIKDNKDVYVEFFKSLPFYIRTKGGVLISHAGASRGVSKLDCLEDLIDLNHGKIIQENLEDEDDGFNTLTPEKKENFKKKLERRFYKDLPYETVLKSLRGTDVGDKKKAETLLQGEYFMYNLDSQGRQINPDAEFLWEMLFNKNEKHLGSSEYIKTINNFLERVSENYTEQKLIVSGHFHNEAGFDIFEDKQLRITSSEEAGNPTAKSFLVIDAGKTYLSARELADNIHTLYPETVDENLSKRVEELSKKYPIKTRYNISTLKLDLNTLNLSNPKVLQDLDEKITKGKLMVEGGIKPKNSTINKILFEIIDVLERRDVKIEEILTDGGSNYEIKYEKSPEMKGVIAIEYDVVVDHNQEYGELPIIKVESGNGFVHITDMQVPIGEKILEGGKKAILLSSIRFPASKDKIDKLLETYKEELPNLPAEILKNFVRKYIFRRSVLEEPYTDLSEKKFIKKLLKN